jgi:hypothetical protein
MRVVKDVMEGVMVSEDINVGVDEVMLVLTKPFY